MSGENQELRKAGLKVTLPRVKILQLLENSETRHLSAEDVYKALIEADEDVGLATVYRVLTQFETAGLVMRHHFEGGHSVFELSTMEHHDHIVCNKCGLVEEFYDEVIETQQEKIAAKFGFEITDHSLYLYGICKTCQKAQA
ncbi:MAG: ferric iron uptake transcriptional regulator [Gammaproteobacteria bacterium]|nr:ferric iron uptake transcriptional regulator [Gammaproteobacteria bacterium]MDP2141871.1 ferric iron uptake transcriptional regulator [Gammaproteobacteria bacterium]MDP2348178.1 ferric iron uptake transcriptional regulator [Gammaproteobacteria bacterium]